MSKFVLAWQVFTYIFPFASHVVSIVASFPPPRFKDVMIMWMRWWKNCINAVLFWQTNPLTPSILDFRLILQCSPNSTPLKRKKKALTPFKFVPDDLTPDFLRCLRQMGVNRLSMGVQSFDDTRLRFLHRRHTAAQAIQAVRNAQEAGFTNISIDLMFGFPSQTLDQWKQDVQMALSLQVQHLSAYSLMYEEGTLLEQMLASGEIEEVDDEVSLQMYKYLMDALEGAGYEHYELSNFALPGMQSRHNSSYWHGIPYLGVGAGAHSYDGHDRYFHPDSLEHYMSDVLALETEHLNEHERYDEFVFTALRTSEGLHLLELEQQFGALYKESCLQNAQQHLKAGLLSLTGDTLCLTRRGLFISNEVMSDLMWDD